MTDSIDLEKVAGYLAQVADKAAFVLSEIDVSALQSQFTLPIIYLPSIRDFLGSLIQTSLQQQHPTKLPAVIAVTGTNGKTTVSQLVAQLISQSGIKTAVMGTAGNGVLGEKGQPILPQVPTRRLKSLICNMRLMIFCQTRCTSVSH